MNTNTLHGKQNYFKTWPKLSKSDHTTNIPVTHKNTSSSCDHINKTETTVSNNEVNINSQNNPTNCNSNVEVQKHDNSKNSKSSRPGNTFTFTSEKTLHSQSDDKNLKHETSQHADNALSREEIIAERKLKVAARKQIKKKEKQRLAEITSVFQRTNPEFSLEKCADDFPTLNSSQIKRKTFKSIQKTNGNNTTEDSLEVEALGGGCKSIKAVEKSWKPKVKDPISFDICQALQSTTEKHKPAPKKVDLDAHRNVLSGNILDSDNPKRKKGKVRPDKVKKPSKLKSHILSGRKQKQKNLAESSENDSELCESLHLESKDNCETNLNEDIKNDGAILTEDIKNDCANLTEDIKNDGANVIEDIKNDGANLTNADTKDITSENKNTNNNQEVLPDVSKKLYSRKFREYCTNLLTEGIIKSIYALLERVTYFQDRLYSREPIKACAKRRYVAGINQTCKYLHVKKVKILIIAPDLEKNPGKGGLDEKIQYLIKEAEFQNVPCAFGPNRNRLGRAVKKNSLVSCVAVLNYEGAEVLYSKFTEALDEAKSLYLKRIGKCPEIDSATDMVPAPKDEKSFSFANDVTSTLLESLREDLTPADKLLNALRPGCLNEDLREDLSPADRLLNALRPGCVNEDLREDLLPADRILNALRPGCLNEE